MLLFTTLCVAAVVVDERVRKNMKNYWYLMYVGLIGGFICMCVITCSTKERCKFARKVPCNFVILAVFTAFWSLMVACFTAFFNPFIVVIAVTMTACTTFGLVTCSMCVKSEMTWLWGVAGAILFALAPLVLFSFFFRSLWLANLISFLGCIIFSIYIVLDIKLIMNRIGLDEYIIGALMLYSDII